MSNAVLYSCFVLVFFSFFCNPFKTVLLTLHKPCIPVPGLGPPTVAVSSGARVEGAEFLFECTLLSRRSEGRFPFCLRPCGPTQGLLWFGALWAAEGRFQIKRVGPLNLS